jgi:hypothetical protein
LGHIRQAALHAVVKGRLAEKNLYGWTRLNIGTKALHAINFIFSAIIGFDPAFPTEIPPYDILIKLAVTSNGRITDN